MRFPAAAFIGVALAVLAGAARAEVIRVEVAKRQSVLNGQAFGSAGAYEWIEGRILFGFDPKNRFNQRIVDLDRAPRNPTGRVEAWADFAVLRPVRPVDRGVTLFEVSNRGGKMALSFFNYATSAAHPSTAADFGDGFLMRHGITVVWIGWQTDIPDDPDRLRLDAPVARNLNGTPITGLVRADWVINAPTRTVSLGHGGSVAYPVLDPASAENVLTVRAGRYDARRVVPRAEWRLARDSGTAVIPDSTRLHLPAGFVPGMVYELVYRSRDPKVAGLGLAVIRDAVAYGKHDSTSLFPTRYAIGAGVSQTGRFLRHLVYQGFTTDEHGRPTFDGLLIHVAGAGRGSFNHRFAQPSRDAHRFDAFFFPTDLFPFTGRRQVDPVSKASDGLFGHVADSTHLPKVFSVNGGYEYWGRAASLIHTTVDGRADVPPMPNERIYHLAGTQHVPGRFPPPADTRMPGEGAYRGNPLDYFPAMRALLVGLVGWVTDGAEPLPSVYPRIAAGELVPIDQVRFPSVADLTRPTVVHQADRLDFGPRWRAGIIDREPPIVRPPFPTLVPQVDSLGNEVGGIRSVELEAPLATYTPWNLRTGMPGPATELTRILGSYLPLSPSEAGRRERRDPRPSVASLYRDRADYVARARTAALRLVSGRMLLAEDVDRVVRRAEEHWDWVGRE